MVSLFRNVYIGIIAFLLGMNLERRNKDTDTVYLDKLVPVYVTTNAVDAEVVYWQKLALESTDAKKYYEALTRIRDLEQSK